MSVSFDKQLWTTPACYECPEAPPQGAKSLFYDGLLDTEALRQRDALNHSVRGLMLDGPPYEGRRTRIFAWVGTPPTPPPWPAVVLVHGGGGGAFEAWVRRWNARGYAAIAPDTCGCLPLGEYNAWQRHPDGGPPGWGGFDQTDRPLTDQWPYHAVASVIVARSYLASLAGVDPHRVGITGVSWGGYLTCIAASVDQRYQAAVPVYGCGYLQLGSAWVEVLRSLGAAGDAWLAHWDPGGYLRRLRTPIRWVTGTNDFAYPLDALMASYIAVRGPRSLSITWQMPHGHGGYGENPIEVSAFLDAHLLPEASAGLQIMRHGRTRHGVYAMTNKPPSQAELLWTASSRLDPNSIWNRMPVGIDGRRAEAALPDGAEAVILNVTDACGETVSTPVYRR